MACGRHLSRCGAALLCTALLWHGAAGSELLQRLSRAHFDFTLSMFSTMVNITDDRQQNLLISPYSVFSLVSMLFLGAGSESLSSAQLRAVLRFHNISYASAQRAFQEVTHVLDDPYYRRSFREAAGLLLSSEVEPADMYTRAVRQFYGRAVSRLDFADPAAADDVAAWLRGAANVSVGADGGRWSALDVALSDSPVLLLTSQAHFHGRWLRPFDLKRTFSKGLFFSEPSKRLEVPMMTGRFVLPLGYSADMESRVLELPLYTRRISIFLLLPDDMERGLARLEANLTMDNLRTLLATLKEAIVNVKLPRFRLESSGDLRTVLMTQGLTDVFDPNSADLTGIDPEGRVHPSNLFYTASVVVDESGDGGDGGDGGDTLRVEQVAPPTDQVAPSSDPRLTDKYFEVDHPFVFLVWDYHSAMVLLMGRVVHPDPIY